MDLSSRTVLVTGGGSGQGADLAHQLAGTGATVHITGRRAEALQAVAGAHPNIHAHQADMTEEAAVKALYADIGPAQIVIANAGMAESAPLHRTSLESWQQIMAVNLTAVFLTFREGLQALRAEKQEWGRFIAIASIAGLRGYPYVSAYAASKHGVIGLVKSAALENARAGFTFNAICPGYLDTEMTDRTLDNIMEKTGKSRDEARDALTAMNPQGRLIQPAEVTRMALFLCGPDTDSITGQALSISGGET
jgi:3-hydroxybutyrate dehydrogenase